MPLDHAAGPENVRSLWHNPERLVADSADRKPGLNAGLLLRDNLGENRI